MNKSMLKAIPVALLITSALSAQALTPGSGTWVKETATYGTPNLQDAYVYVPKNTSPQTIGTGRALMITLHGCAMTASGNVISNKYGWDATAEKYGMVIVAPTVPSGTTSTRIVSGCWDWFGSSHTRTNRDMVPLKKLIDSIKSRSGLDIDPKQIYFTGLSSGGGQTIVAGCMLPDYFAGIGINAGPALGSAAGDISVDPKVTAANVASYCKSAATSSYTSYFATQIANAVYGSSDYIVKPAHNVRNLEGLASVYGMGYSNPTTSSIAGGGTVKVYKDGSGKERLSDISISGMGHAWPAGSTAAGGVSYVETKYIDYPAWITNWFFTNNLRVSGGSITTTSSTTTTSGSGTTATTATTTTTTAPQVCYSSSISATCVTHYVAKRLSMTQYLSCGSKIGYVNSVMLYKTSSGTWTNKPDCSALAF